MARRTRASFSPEKVVVTATATRGGIEGKTAARSRAAPWGAPGISTVRRMPPPARSAIGLRRKRRAGLSRASWGCATTNTALRARSAATSSESGSSCTASPPIVAMPRSRRDGIAARQAAARSPAVAEWAIAESATSCRGVAAPISTSSSSTRTPVSPSPTRSRTLGTLASAARRRVPPARGAAPWAASSWASSIRVGRW